MSNYQHRLPGLSVTPPKYTLLRFVLSGGRRVPVAKPLTPKQRDAIRQRDRYLCVKCERYGMQVDHIVPRRFGGGNNPENLQLLCEECHERKTAVDAADLRQRGAHLQRLSKEGWQRAEAYDRCRRDQCDPNTCPLCTGEWERLIEAHDRDRCFLEDEPCWLCTNEGKDSVYAPLDAHLRGDCSEWAYEHCTYCNSEGVDRKACSRGDEGHNWSVCLVCARSEVQLHREFALRGKPCESGCAVCEYLEHIKEKPWPIRLL